ncbi:MAG: DUF6351 family protein [Anaerolineae bacterium]|nr:DUF6351 family protein [Anaerolineae bacterium]
MIDDSRFPAMRRRQWLLILLLLLLAAAVPAAAQGVAHAEFLISLPATVAGNVTGGNARLHVAVPEGVALDAVKVLVNGEDQRHHLAPIPGTHTLSGVVDGLKLGKNQVMVLATGPSRVRPHPVRIELTNYPITGPVFSGPHQTPFICTVQRHGLGQPLVDNDSTGFTVFAPDGTVAGYSTNCTAETLVTFIYRTTAGAWQPYDPAAPRPADMAQTTTLDGNTVDYVVRWERGTINRFIYSIAVLAPDDTSPDDLTRSAWNGRLLYHFQGGVGIGRYQGDPSTGTMLYEPALSQGYAIAYSTGNRTSTHYNLVLGGETALMVKERFVELYDAPLYTVGLGGSGGAIQQYVYGQNHPGLLDAAIPQYSYPDMVTQTIHVGDCELLEFYMDVLDGTNPRWQTWSNRTLLEGLNASDTFFNPYTQQLGSTECINGWRGLSPLALNPHYGQAGGQEFYVPQSAIEAVHWTHFEDIVNIVGVAADGYARNYWDNVGVQYGLESVASGTITPAEFLTVNTAVGGWKNEPEMVQEGSPFFPPGVVDPTNWDPWSRRNQIFSIDPANPAPRTEGDMQAMNAVYEAGLVFVGDIDIPIVDWRHYLEEHLDMHNSHQSFASRQRILEHNGTYENQVIWFTDVGPGGPEFDQTPEALAVIDQWMLNILANPEAGVAANKPPLATDRCFDAAGNELAAGDGVWAGILDNAPAGACTQQFPIYATSRILAGAPLKGGIFKCQLQPVAQAIASGAYGVWTPSAAEQQVLEQIFPDGVCDYSQPDAGRPVGW